MKKKIIKSDCYNCDDDFYNNYNVSGVKECQYFKSAKLIKRKKVPLNQRPPWTQKAYLCPSCYRQKGFIFVNEHQEK